MAAIGTDHTETLGRLRTPVPARDACTAGSASCCIAGCTIVANEFFGRLLLRRRKPLPQIAVEETFDRAGSASSLVLSLSSRINIFAFASMPVQNGIEKGRMPYALTKIPGFRLARGLRGGYPE